MTCTAREQLYCDIADAGHEEISDSFFALLDNALWENRSKGRSGIYDHVVMRWF
jgi:hypothetical protein